MALEKTIEAKYLALCNPENPLHFMTLWMTRSYLAKMRLLEHYSNYFKSPLAQQTDTLRNAALSDALCMLKCDTVLMNSPLAKGFLWLVHFHFPFSAYIHIVQDLRKRPMEEHAEKTWGVMSDNYEARFMKLEKEDYRFFHIFARIIVPAWEAREAAARQMEKSLEPPRIVAEIQRRTVEMKMKTATASSDADTEPPNRAVSMMNIDDSSTSLSMDFGGGGGGGGGHGHGLGYAGTGMGVPVPTGLGSTEAFSYYPDMSGQTTMDMDLDANQLDWTTMAWNPIFAQGW